MSALGNNYAGSTADKGRSGGVHERGGRGRERKVGLRRICQDDAPTVTPQLTCRLFLHLQFTTQIYINNKHRIN